MGTLRGKFAAFALVCVAAMSACTGAEATPRTVVVTPTPASTDTAGATPTVAVTQTAPAGANDATPTPTAAAKPTATPTAKPTATAPAVPTATLAATPTPTPAATPTSPALACTGNDGNRTFFAESAAKLKFDVYCAVLPKGWYMASAKYELNNGGYFEVVYSNKAGNQVKLIEGNFCYITMTCTLVGSLGAASFGDLPALLHDTSASLLVAAKFGTTQAYGMHTVGVTQADTLAWAAALHKVPKS